MKRIVGMAIILGSLLVLTSCNFGNTAALHKEWNAMLDELEWRTESYLLPELDQVDVMIYTYNFTEDNAMLDALLTTDDGLIDYKVTDGEAFDFISEPHRFSFEEHEIVYGESDILTGVLTNLQIKDQAIMVQADFLSLADAESYLESFLSDIKKRDHIYTYYDAVRKEIMEQAKIFALGADQPNELTVTWSEERVEIALAFENPEIGKMVFFMMTEEAGDFFADEYEMESLTFDHRPVEKYVLSDQSVLGILPERKYRFEREGLYYGFDVEELADDFRDEQILEYIKRLRR